MAKWVGAHVSAAGGVENAVRNASEIDANAFGLFTKNQRRWSAKPLTDTNIQLFKEYCDELGYTSERILPHASYLINLGHPEEEGITKSRNALLDELQRCEQLGITMLNVHPGAHLDQISETECIERIGSSIDWCIEQTEFATVVIENTAGQGTSLGHTFEQIKAMIDNVKHTDRVGVCIDTCHAFAAGYPIDKADGYKDTINKFEAVVGLNYLSGLHLNDSKKVRGSRVDRHDILGEGEIGWDTFRWIMNDDRFEDLPLILETPNKEHWDEEIEALYSLPD